MFVTSLQAMKDSHKFTAVAKARKTSSCFAKQSLPLLPNDPIRANKDKSEVFMTITAYLVKLYSYLQCHQRIEPFDKQKIANKFCKSDDEEKFLDIVME